MATVEPSECCEKVQKPLQSKNLAVNPGAMAHKFRESLRSCLEPLEGLQTAVLSPVNSTHTLMLTNRETLNRSEN